MWIPIIALLWVGNNYRMMRNEKRKTSVKGLLLGPAVNLLGRSK
jgi:hypothetical protein